MDVNDLYDLLKFVVLYLAIGIVAAFIAVGLLVWFSDAKNSTTLKNTASVSS